jgi:hypothetical protein
VDPRDKRIEDLEESNANLLQQRDQARGQVERMAVALTRDGQTKMAEIAANQVEEIFAVGGMSRAQRFANITNIIRRQIAYAIAGEKYWQD